MARQSASSASSQSNPERVRSIGDFFRDVGVRETIESILVAVMLALLFKAFEAEAFVIPTGSMASTLQGRHKDVCCEQCGYQYRVSASAENPDAGFGRVDDTTCPICRYAQIVDSQANPNQDSFSGDRILVSKFAYDIAEPRRWDVIVFRYPENAKQNYIKRLTGLPGEFILIEHGDLLVWMAPEGETAGRPKSKADFKIARKDHRKLLAMMQLVDDNHYVAPALIDVGWPLRWQEWGVNEPARLWRSEIVDGHPVYTVEPTPETAWLRYRHLVPRRREWLEILDGRLPPRIANHRGELITDYYEYNDSIPVKPTGSPRTATNGLPSPRQFANRGLHWVGDIAVEADVEVRSPEGQLTLQLVEGGVKFNCQIDVATGEAVVSADSDVVRFETSPGELGDAGYRPQATTSIRRPGKYRLRFANADDRLYLWINDRPIEFDSDATFQRTGPVRPQWSATDPGDAEPLGIGAKDLALTVRRLKVLRDIYYVSYRGATAGPSPYDYGASPIASYEEIRMVLESPELWVTPDAVGLFDSRDRSYDDLRVFELGEDQFFALGDNSPASSDARAWREQQYVDRENLVGKALLIYWPHTWWRPIPFLPNFRRMGFIR